jgi:hypothetical protein
MGSTGGSAGPLSFATAGLSVASDITKGQGTAAADDFKAQQLEQSAKYGRLNAVQTSGQMSENLNRTLGNIDVIRAAAGTDPTSPTSVALRGQAEYLGDRQRTNTVDSILAQATQNDAAADYERQAGNFALNQSYMTAGLDVAKSFTKAG